MYNFEPGLPEEYVPTENISSESQWLDRYSHQPFMQFPDEWKMKMVMPEDESKS